MYPNNEQRTQMAKTFGCCRFVYNQTLTSSGGKNIIERKNHLVKLTVTITATDN
ncbi:MAG: helix-turn-helix domain-containing protein [Enterocloster sp.]